MKPAGELDLIGGDVALDFVNTAEERGHPDADDALRTPSDLRAWGVRYGLIAATTPSSERELRHAIEARELLYRLFLATTRGRSPSRQDLARLAELVAQAHRAGSLEAGHNGRISWHWSRRELATVRHVAVTAAVQLLAREESTRLKQCPGEHCGWFFLDGTKRGNRRWCSMQDCGQDAKVARRRERRR